MTHTVTPELSLLAVRLLRSADDGTLTDATCAEWRRGTPEYHTFLELGSLGYLENDRWGSVRLTLTGKAALAAHDDALQVKREAEEAARKRTQARGFIAVLIGGPADGTTHRMSTLRDFIDQPTELQDLHGMARYFLHDHEDENLDTVVRLYRYEAP